MADCTLPVSQGQEVEIELRNIGVVPGEIIWVRGQQIGVAFLNRIDPRAARVPVGTHASETMLVKRPSQRARRPGLRSE